MAFKRPNCDIDIGNLCETSLLLCELNFVFQVNLRSRLNSLKETRCLLSLKLEVWYFKVRFKNLWTKLLDFANSDSISKPNDLVLEDLVESDSI